MIERDAIAQPKLARMLLGGMWRDHPCAREYGTKFR